jgi:hypothetical protein
VRADVHTYRLMLLRTWNKETMRPLRRIGPSKRRASSYLLPSFPPAAFLPIFRTTPSLPLSILYISAIRRCCYAGDWFPLT